MLKLLNITVSRTFVNLGLLFSVSLLTACQGAVPTTLGLQGGRLAACPDKPNCVQSQNIDAELDPQHAITALAFTGSSADGKLSLKRAIDAYDKEAVKWHVDETTDEGNYLHLTFTTSLMKYIDDVEFLITDDVIHVRSASRVGHGDMGANRARIDAIRAGMH